MKITFEHITKKYKHKYALQDFSAVLEDGVIGLLGANGAGKTTLIHILAGILKGDYGRILVDGVDVKTLGKSFLSYLGYLPQYPIFYKNFEVIDFLRYVCALKDIQEDIGEKQICELLDTVNLTQEAHKKIGALSGGMRQRMGIAQAMLGNPSILILDEPTAGLDPQERIRFRNLITKFSENRIVLLATHIVPDIEFIAGQVILLKNGKLLRQASPSALMQEIQGKVWKVIVPDGRIEEKLSSLKISNMLRSENGIELRIIDDMKPNAHAVAVLPGLEDVFLYYFGESEI